jgi:RNA polymerase primary sigma factor
MQGELEMKNPSKTNSKIVDRDVAQIYLREVSKNKLLTHAQEIELSQQIENAKQHLIGVLFAIPMCVKYFDQQIMLILNGSSDQCLAFDWETVNSQQLMQELVQLHSMIEIYVQNNCTDLNVRLQIGEKISQLPLKLAFFDIASNPLLDKGRKLSQVQGEFMRFAANYNISRQMFLDNHLDPIPCDQWKSFASKNLSVVEHFQQQIVKICNPIGLDAREFVNALEQIRQWQKIKDKSVETMLKSNLRLVVSVAKKYINISNTPMLDLVQEGNIGLLKAIEKYNWRLGYRFSTYATWWIKQCVLKALNEQHRIIRVPSHMTHLVKRVGKAQEEFLAAHGYEAGIEDLAQMLDVDREQVRKVYTVAQGTISLETPIGQEEDQNLGSVLEDVEHVNAFDLLAQVDAQENMSKILALLTPKEERVIRMRFGIGMDKESTLEDIGNIMGVTRERIRQIELKALQKLKSTEFVEKIQQDCQ